MIHAEKLSLTPRGIKPFIDLPFELYREDPNWVPPDRGAQTRLLCGGKTLYGETLRAFLVFDGSRPVARVLAGIDERMNEKTGERTGSIALFESASGVDYAKTALDTACGYLKDRGMEKVIGPSPLTVGGLTKGVLAEGFDGAPVLMNPYNPDVYPFYFEKCGFSKYRDHYAYIIDMARFDLASLDQLAGRVTKRFGFRIEHAVLNAGTTEKLLSDMHTVISRSIPAEWPVCIPDRDQMKRELDRIRRYWCEETVILAYAGKDPIGLVLAFPDPSRLARRLKVLPCPRPLIRHELMKGHIEGARCMAQFVVPEYRHKAVSVPMLCEAYTQARRLGIRWVEGSTIDETDIVSISNTERLGATRYRTYRQYKKTL